MTTKHFHVNKATDTLDENEAAQQIRELLGKVAGLSTLVPGNRRKLIKMRPGSERYIRMMARLAEERPLACPPGVDPTSVNAKLDVVDRLAALRTALDQGLRTVDDTILQALAQAYSDALDIYGLAQRQLKRQPDMYAEISPFEAFLKTGARPHSVEPPPPVTTEPNGSDAA